MEKTEIYISNLEELESFCCRLLVEPESFVTYHKKYSWLLHEILIYNNSSVDLNTLCSLNELGINKLYETINLINCYEFIKKSYEIILRDYLINLTWIEKFLNYFSITYKDFYEERIKFCNENIKILTDRQSIVTSKLEYQKRPEIIEELLKTWEIMRNCGR